MMFQRPYIHADTGRSGGKRAISGQNYECLSKLVQVVVVVMFVV